MSECCTSDLRLDNAVYLSEAATGHQNEKIAQVLRNAGIVESDHDMKHGLQAYFMACSTLVDCKDLAMMAATCANKGLNPKTKVRVMDEKVAEAVSSVMMSCGEHLPSYLLSLH
jgi:glutaminase